MLLKNQVVSQVLKGIIDLFGAGCPNAVLCRPCNWLKRVRKLSMLLVWFGLCLNLCELQGLVLGKFTSKSVTKCINYANIYSWFLAYWSVFLSLTVIHSSGDTVDGVRHLSPWIMVACHTLSSMGSCFNYLYMPKYWWMLFVWVTLLYWASINWQCVKQSRPGRGCRCLKPVPVGILH